MPNWCSNRLKITGSKEGVDAVKALVSNELGNVDFEVLLPMPAGLKVLIENLLDGVYADFKNTPYHGFNFNAENPERLGLSTPDLFIDNLPSFCDKHDCKGALEGLTYSEIKALLESSEIIKDNTPIETSISQAVDEWRKIPESQREIKNSPLRDKIVAMLIGILHTDHDAYCKQTYGYDNPLDWSRETWGTKWNASSNEETSHSEDQVFKQEFTTAWCPPRAWIQSLISAVKAMNNTDVSITVDFAEDAMWFGGSIGIDNGREFDRTYSDQEVADFFGVALEY